MNNNQPLIRQSLDGREFVMESSTSSAVDPETPTRFHYRQHNDMLWGEYTGDTVSIGRFIGRREGDRIIINFAHANAVTGVVTRGKASSVIEQTGTGGLRLIEDYEFDGVAHRSVCIEVDSADNATNDGANGDEALPAPGEQSLDGRTFVLRSSTASTVNHDAPSTFQFREADGITWGSYYGDTVTSGHLVGVRDGDTLHESFVHELVTTGQALMGESSTRVVRGADGRLELIEEFVLDGVPGQSICVELGYDG